MRRSSRQCGSAVLQSAPNLAFVFVSKLYFVGVALSADGDGDVVSAFTSSTSASIARVKFLRPVRLPIPSLDAFE